MAHTNEIPEKFITHAMVHERSGNRTIITKPDLSWTTLTPGKLEMWYTNSDLLVTSSRYNK